MLNHVTFVKTIVTCDHFNFTLFIKQKDLLPALKKIKDEYMRREVGKIGLTVQMRAVRISNVKAVKLYNVLQKLSLEKINF